MWELDRKLLQQHALPLVERYTWETGTVLKALEMDEFVPPAPGSGPGPRVARRIQRSGRCAVQFPALFSPFLYFLCCALLCNSYTAHPAAARGCASPVASSPPADAGLRNITSQ